MSNNPIAIDTRVVSSGLAVVDDYQALHSFSTAMNVQEHHQEMLDRATMGGKHFDYVSVNKALAGACGITDSRGVVPLADTGNLSFDGVQQQYRKPRYSFQINVEYRTYGMHGFATLCGFTDRAEVHGNVIPPNLEFCVNTVTLYVMTRDGNNKPRPKQVYTGRIHGKQPTAPVQKMRDTNVAGTSLSFGFGGGRDGGVTSSMSNNNFGLLTGPSIGAQIGVEASLGNNIDTRLMPGINGSSFEANNSAKVVTKLLQGFVEGKEAAMSMYEETAGRWVDDESAMFEGGNALSMSWAIAASNGTSEEMLSQNRLIGYIRKMVPSFELNCKLQWNQLTRLFPNIDNATTVGSVSLHREMETVFGLKNDSLNLSGSHIENQLANRAVQLIPSAVAQRGFTRFSFMATNRSGGSFGSNKDMLNPMANIEHPFMNRHPEAMREHINSTLEGLKHDLCAMLSDNGNRHYMIEVHYVFRADARITIDIGNGPKQFIYAKFPDSSAASAASFNFKTDMSNMTGNITSLSEGIGWCNIDAEPASGSFGGWGKAPSGPKNDGWGSEVNTDNWGSFSATPSSLTKF